MDKASGKLWTGPEDAERQLPQRVPRPRLHLVRQWAEGENAYRAELYDYVVGGTLSPTPVPAAALRLTRAWWDDLRQALGHLAVVRTERTAVRQAYLDRTMPKYLAFLDGPVPTTPPAWSTAHGDLHWANLTGPELGILDWEGWGTAPAGYDAALLHAYSIGMPETAERVRDELSTALDSDAGRFAELVVITELLQSAERGDNSELVPALRQRAGEVWHRPLVRGALGGHRRLAAVHAALLHPQEGARGERGRHLGRHGHGDRREGYSGEEYTMAAVFKGGTWSAPRRLSATSAQSTGAPQVAADALGRPVVLWDEYKLAETNSIVLDGVQQATTTSRALPKWGDYTDDGKSDLFGRGSAGLKVYAGDATKLSAGQRASSWPSGTLVLPYGDLDGDRCNDVFVRYPKGEARVYPTVCGGLPDQQSFHVKVSSDWSGYDAVVSPGDVTGDGRADLLTRSASTGKLYVYANNGAGGFKARSLAGSGFGGYKKLLAAGDLDGDGKNDLLALDASNELWRFRGTGTGTFKPRSLVFKDWGTSYKDVVGGLDLSGDGRADLISLDKTGHAWLNRGNGQGGFGNRSQAGKTTNWSAIRIS
ncbi:FG-GAP-like repeat-containing protein [Streptomyces sp. NPDC058240]|uniref:FG-GAP-like repeat-containing protein n=1 Tax=Streptomyces sp. NPDC058240 TaxID=3346396 RepID=UPI0036E5BA9C